MELACQIKARLLTLDRQFADDSRPETQSYVGVRTYLGLVHGLTRQLKELGLTAQVLLKQKHTGPPGLQERLQLLQGGKAK